MSTHKTYSAIPGDRNQCECADRSCPVHLGRTRCPNYGRTLLYRIDMEDNTGTLFCESCADDAMMSGLFTDSNTEEDES